MEYSRESIGLVIKVIRKEKLGIEQRELGKAMGATQGTISKIENGTLEPSGSFLLKFFKTYKIPYEDFTKLIDVYIRETLRLQKSKVKISERNKILIEKLSKKIA